MCRTCHVYVDNKTLSGLPEKVEAEIDLTRFIQNKTANSRFACEIVLDKKLAGMTVIIPDYPADIL
jgi:2Fe-2S ferredoxin